MNFGHFSNIFIEIVDFVISVFILPHFKFIH